jgi:hypothetical protein
MTAEPSAIDALRPRDWRQLARAAALLDLSEGAYFDMCARAITLWAGPENKPAGWPAELPIAAGTLPHARAVVGAITDAWPGGHVAWASDHAYPILLTIRISEVAAWRWPRSPTLARRPGGQPRGR